MLTLRWPTTTQTDVVARLPIEGASLMELSGIALQEVLSFLNLVWFRKHHIAITDKVYRNFPSSHVKGFLPHFKIMFEVEHLFVYFILPCSLKNGFPIICPTVPVHASILFSAVSLTRY